MWQHKSIQYKECNMKKIICLTMMAAMLFCSAFGIGSSATAEPGQEPDFEIQPVALDASDPDYNPYAVVAETGIHAVELVFAEADEPVEIGRAHV